MNKKVKIFAAFVVIFSMIMCFAGCGNDKISNNPSSNSIKKKINIEDIAWNIDEGIVDGGRYVLLSYTNNTEYTITDSSEFCAAFRRNIKDRRSGLLVHIKAVYLSKLYHSVGFLAFLDEKFACIIKHICSNHHLRICNLAAGDFKTALLDSSETL